MIRKLSCQKSFVELCLFFFVYPNVQCPAFWIQKGRTTLSSLREGLYICSVIQNPIGQERFRNLIINN